MDPIGRYSAQRHTSVSSCLPQGCACAPLALVSLLVKATRDVQTLHTVCDPVTQATFLDDRSAAGQEIFGSLGTPVEQAENSVSTAKRRATGFGAAWKTLHSARQALGVLLFVTLISRWCHPDGRAKDVSTQHWLPRH